MESSSELSRSVSLSDCIAAPKIYRMFPVLEAMFPVLEAMFPVLEAMFYCNFSPFPDSDGEYEI
jgi:hypothetical protein